MVIPARFERATYCLEGSCSIQLSYGTIKMSSLELASITRYVNIGLLLKKETTYGFSQPNVKLLICRISSDAKSSIEPCINSLNELNIIRIHAIVRNCCQS